MKILLTGRDGQVGFLLKALLAPLGEVVATDRAQLDLAQPQAVRQAVERLRPSLIVNAAAYTAVDRAEEEPGIAMRVNAQAPAVLAEAAQRQGALLVHFSTDYVFDGAKETPYLEADAPAPLNAYGRSKLEGERAIAAAGCRHLILRSGWVYGPRGRNFALAILERAQRGEALRVVDDQFGAPTSSEALAKATVQAIRAGGEGLYHVTCAGRASWHEFASLIVRSAKLRVPVAAVSAAEYGARAHRPRNSQLDNGKALRDLGLKLPAWDAEATRMLAGIA